MNKKLRDIFDAEMQNFKDKMEKAFEEVMNDQAIYEEIEIGAVMVVAEDMDLETADGESITVMADYFMVADSAKSEGLYYVDIYDDESNLVQESVIMSEEDLDDLLENGIIMMVDDDMLEIEETAINEVDAAKISFKGGKKRVFKLKPKKGFARKDGKYVRLSAKQKKAMKLQAKKMARKPKTAASMKKRKRSMKLRRRMVKDSVQYTVKEGFDVLDGKDEDMRTIALENGDTFTIENNKLNILREGKNLINGVTVDETFIANCISESLVEEVADEVDLEEEIPVEDPKPEDGESNEPTEDEETPKEDEEEDKEPKEDEEEEDKEDEEEPEAEVKESILSFRNDKGYVLTKEGVTTTLGNRVRARTYLVKEGYDITSNTLDTAFNGQQVIL